MANIEPVDVGTYQRFVDRLQLASRNVGKSDLVGLLDGEASKELRQTVPLSQRRSLGAFFTPHRLADELVEPLQDAGGDLQILDPSCGAGELLLAAVRILPAPQSPAQRSVALLGIDIVPQFVDATAERLRMALQIRSDANTTVMARCGDGRSTPELRSATHILLNPPFVPTRVNPDCTWASGTVNSAAAFVENVVTAARERVVLHAILPEVLRSGSRYKRWRKFVDQHMNVTSIVATGRFDRWTDVDVFILRGEIDLASLTARESWTPTSSGITVQDKFRVSVGTVVNNRDPHEGVRVPYLTSKRFPSWQTINSVHQYRHFAGRLYDGPLVVIPRTSRPEESVRARGAVVVDPRSVAIDNHLLVAAPLDGKVETCHELLLVLKSPVSTAWLNQVICCRHLTVGAVSGIPWGSDA